MGEAFTSIPSDEGGVGSQHYNPGSTAFLKNPEFSLTGRNGISDDRFGSMILGVPTRFGSLSGSFSYYGIGNVDLVDPEGRTRSVRAEDDTAVNLNYGKSLGGRLGLGFNLKYLQSKIAESLSASAIAADLGAQLKLNSFSLGLAVQNLGSSLKYRNTRESLPALVRGGASYKRDLNLSGRPERLILSFDLVKETGVNLKEFFGLEYLWNGMIAFRSGSKLGPDSEPLVIGVGFIVGRVQIDYNHSNIIEANGFHTLSLTYKFSKNIPPTNP